MKKIGVQPRAQGIVRSSRKAKEKCAAPLGGPARQVAKIQPAGSVSPLDLLLPYQTRWVQDDSRFKIGVQSRQTGKSFSTACEAVSDCLMDPGAQWVCLSAGERQALEWLEKCKQWATAFQMAIESYAEDRAIGEALLKKAEIRFANGSRIVAIPANPSTARGYSANIILDEFAYHEDPDKIWAAMFPSLTNPLAGTFLQRVGALYAGESIDIKRNMKIRVVSTFNGRDNKFFDLWKRQKENGWNGHKVDIYTAVKEGLPLDIDELRAGLDDPEIWAQEYECEPTDTSNVLLPYDLIAKCEAHELTLSQYAGFWDVLHPNLFLGIDFGRKRDLTVCWTNERIADTGFTREVLELAAMSTPNQVEILSPRIRVAQRVCLDYTGPGIGLGDYLVKEFGEYDPAHHKFGKIELCTFTAPFKRELFPKLRMAFEGGKIRIPESRVIREDLHSVCRITSMGGEISYRAPHTADGHADRCTALALAVRAMSGTTDITTGSSVPIRPNGRTGRRMGRNVGAML